MTASPGSFDVNTPSWVISATVGLSDDHMIFFSQASNGSTVANKFICECGSKSSELLFIVTPLTDGRDHILSEYIVHSPVVLYSYTD